MTDSEIGKVVDALTDKLIGMDASPKMILHDPYRHILLRIESEFSEELEAYYDQMEKEETARSKL